MNVERILKNKKKLQADTSEIKVVSFGSENGTKSFIDEIPKSLEFGFEIINDSNVAKDVIITASPFDMFPTVKAYMEELAGTDLFLADGVIETADGGDLSAVTSNARRSIDLVTSYAMNAPFRFTKFVMTSSKVDGTPESTNYNNDIRTGWISPFEDTVPKEFSLRSIVRDKFQAQLLEVDFQLDAPNLLPIVSNEHFMVIRVNAKTRLSILSYVGAQLSQPQYLYRLAKSADNVMRTERI